jgi:hypothetical protein
MFILIETQLGFGSRKGPVERAATLMRFVFRSCALVWSSYKEEKKAFRGDHVSLFLNSAFLDFRETVLENSIFRS